MRTTYEQHMTRLYKLFHSEEPKWILNRNTRHCFLILTTLCKVFQMHNLSSPHIKFIANSSTNILVDWGKKWKKALWNWAPEAAPETTASSTSVL